MNHVFVWTFQDVFSMIFLSALILLGLALGGLTTIEKIRQLWRKSWQKKKMK